MLPCSTRGSENMKTPIIAGAVGTWLPVVAWLAPLVAATALALCLCLPGSLRAGDFPTVKLPLPDMHATESNGVPSIDLRNYFEINGITGLVVQLRTTSGTFNLDTFATEAPVTVSNFLNYVNSGRYVTSIVHRSDRSLGVIQGGGYMLPTFDTMVTDPPIPLEYRLPNARGTIAMARAAATNSATSQWFINTKDNSTTLGQANGGGYAVFGRVTGTGMAVVDAIGALPVYAFSSPYGQMPLRNYVTNTQVLPEHAIAITTAEAIPVFPTAAGQNSVVTFSVTTSNPTLADATTHGSLLSILPTAGQNGHAHITVTTADSNGNTAQNSF